MYSSTTQSLRVFPDILTSIHTCVIIKEDRGQNTRANTIRTKQDQTIKNKASLYKRKENLSKVI